MSLRFRGFGSEESVKLFTQSIRIPKFAFPEDENAPAGPHKFGNVVRVTNPIAVELGVPELRVGGRPLHALGTVVPMPEASVNEEDRSSAGENQVGPSGQILAV